MLIFLTLMTTSSAYADWINLTGAQSAPNIAEIYVEDDHIRLVLDSLPEHLDGVVRLPSAGKGSTNLHAG